MSTPKTPHLLRFDGEPVELAPVIEAARKLDLRVGWLDLGAPPELQGPLADAANLGVLRAVAVGGGRSVAIKPLRGTPVLRDVLREHFRGCALVVLRGATDLPELARGDARDEWLVRTGAGERATTAERLAASLRSPKRLG